MKQIIRLFFTIFSLFLVVGCGSSSSSSNPTTPSTETEVETKNFQNINELKTFFGNDFEMLSKDCDEVAGTPDGDTRRTFNNPVVGFVRDVGGCMGCIDHVIYELYLNEKTGVKYVEVKYSAPITDNRGMASMKMYNPEWKFQDGKLYVNEDNKDYGFYMYKENDGIYLYSKIMDKASKISPSHFQYMPAELPYCGI